ncbi:MAG: adenosine kinase [Gammaproteobacteria bacterium]|nr:adenosine kinase [Gammaproteobacteria bacterium]
MSKYHVYGVGNALVDIEFDISNDKLAELGVDKGLMTLIDLDRHHELLEQLKNHEGNKCSGGSAANTVIGAAMLGASTFYSCKVANDDTGTFYMQDLAASGVDSNLNMDNREDGVTGKCLVLITPDAERSMNSFLGITSRISERELDASAIADAEYVYIEGYLVPEPNARAAAVKAREIAEAAGAKTALTLSDPNMVQFFKDGLLEIAGNKLDLCFCNDAEAKLMFDTDTLEGCVDGMKSLARQFTITLGSEGALIYDGNDIITLPAPAVKVVDTNGAGDIYAGSFLYGLTHGMSYSKAGELAIAAASRLVTQHGARLTQTEMQSILKQAS